MPADIFSPFSGTPVSEEVLLAAAKVRFLVLDVDGVCTDGKLYFQENGHPMKCFNSQDGIGIKTALRAGIGVGIITGRNDPCVLARMSQLGVRDYYAGFESKLPKLEPRVRFPALAPPTYKSFKSHGSMPVQSRECDVEVIIQACQVWYPGSIPGTRTFSQPFSPSFCGRSACY